MNDDKNKQNLLNRIRKKKLLINVNKDNESSTHDESKKNKILNESKEDWLTKKALEELERTASFHKVKRESFGTTSEPKSKTNKKFLATTLSHAISHNEREKQKHLSKSNVKLKELDRYRKLRNSTQKFGERKHEYRKPEKKASSDEDQ